MIQFNQVWSILIHFDLFWSNLIHFNPVWSILIQFDPFWSILIHFDPFWSSLIVSNPVPNDFPARSVPRWSPDLLSSEGSCPELSCKGADPELLRSGERPGQSQASQDRFGPESFVLKLLLLPKFLFKTFTFT